MLASKAHSFTQQARLAITLAWVAGYTNILTVVTCGTVTSHVSGTASNLGKDVVEGSWPMAGFMLFLMGMFFLGAGLSTVLTETGRRRGWDSIYVLPMAVQAALLGVFAMGLELYEPSALAPGWGTAWMTGAASAGMGLQNATITRISSGVVRTTHLTGVLTDLGAETVQFVYWLLDRRRDVPPGSGRSLLHGVRTHPTARRLALLASIVGSFSLGAGLGTLTHEHWPRWSMIPPVAFLLWIIWQDVRVPICEIEGSGESEAGLDLPEMIAVHHLRKVAGRTGVVHRLPDLLLWCERLPMSKRVVVLDLGDATVLDENAALELRALIKQASGRGRKLVISGISGAQYRAMRDAGAGDALDPMNVCPDLDLAIARAVVIAEEEETKRRRDAETK